MNIEEILGKFKNNELTIDETIKNIKNLGYEDLGYAKIDHNRLSRTGESEVVLCEGKPDKYLTNIFLSIYKQNNCVLGTRASKEQYELLKESLPDIEYDPISKIIKISNNKLDNIGNIVICTGGTADIPIAEEAAQTCEFFGNNVERVYDVGVAGIHRLLANKDKLDKANCIIAIAGMEGALASVVAGMSKVPVIAVPTSVGYGANFNGLSALLSMINSCANGISVVNIDNGYGAGYIASRINHLIENKME